MNTSGTDPWEMGPIIAAGTAVASLAISTHPRRYAPIPQEIPA